MWAMALISISVALMLSTVYSMDMGLMHGTVSLFTPQLSMVLTGIVPTNIRVARLSA